MVGASLRPVTDLEYDIIEKLKDTTKKGLTFYKKGV